MADPNVFHPGSRIRIKKLSILTQKIGFSKLSEICSGLFIPDPDPIFLPTPDLGIMGPGSGSEKHCLQIIQKIVHGRDSPVNLAQPVLVGVV